MPRQQVIRAALENRGALIQVRDLDEACRIANRIAPEHLELSLADAEAWVEKIRHAGAIFIGRYTSESLGDYCAGPNHVLPTSGSARFSSPLGVYDFQKRTSLIRVSQAGVEDARPHRGDAGVWRGPAGTRPLGRVSRRRGNGPTLPGVWYDLGLALFRLRRFQQAIDAFQTALSGQPDFPAAQRALARSISRASRRQAAAPQHEASLAGKSHATGHGHRPLSITGPALQAQHVQQRTPGCVAPAFLR
jgi:tetratricopeptide (TPR) repeat protein